MTWSQGMKLQLGQCVTYDPGYKEPEHGFVTSLQSEEKELRVFVCYDGTGRGQLTPYKDLR